MHDWMDLQNIALAPNELRPVKTNCITIGYRLKTSFREVGKTLPSHERITSSRLLTTLLVNSLLRRHYLTCWVNFPSGASKRINFEFIVIVV